MSISLYTENGNLVLKFPYDKGLVSAIKAMPTANRRWDNLKKAWIIDPSAGQQVANLIQAYTGQIINIPRVQTQQIQTKIIQVMYIGRCKDRSGEKSAFGLSERGDWEFIFPESVLRAWFEAGEEMPSEQSSLFSVLGISKTATDDEIKNGYRRMAKQWHPDLNRNDPDAAEQFMRIQEAYEILSNERSKARYLAGLIFEENIRKTATSTQYSNVVHEYRAPLRCGHIMAEGTYKTGRFVVSKILAWQDIYNAAGQMLVVSWPSGSDKPILQYV
jgi:hypothetical protein